MSPPWGVLHMRHVLQQQPTLVVVLVWVAQVVDVTKYFIGRGERNDGHASCVHVHGEVGQQITDKPVETGPSSVDIDLIA